MSYCEKCFKLNESIKQYLCLSCYLEQKRWSFEIWRVTKDDWSNDPVGFVNPKTLLPFNTWEDAKPFVLLYYF